MQRLLIPITLDVEPNAESLLLEHADFLTRFGLGLGSFGPGTVAVQGIPTLLPDGEVIGFVRDLLDEFSGKGPRGVAQEKMEAVARRLACRGAVKAGEPLARSRVLSLLRQARSLPDLATCPHGRPALLRISLRELKKHFRRT
jgi:DNA mismatch repair protein MutL